MPAGVTSLLQWGLLFPGPLALVALVAAHRERVPGAWPFALAMAMSTVGEAVGIAWDGWSWHITYLWLPVQLLLALRVVADRRAVVGMTLVLLTLAIYDVVAVLPQPDTLLTAVGSVVILYFAALSRHPLVVPLALYFGAGSMLYLLWISRLTDNPAPLWWAYQTIRVLAWAAFLVVLYSWHRRERWVSVA